MCCIHHTNTIKKSFEYAAKKKIKRRKSHVLHETSQMEVKDVNKQVHQEIEVRK
jgi:hypothetical protein